MAASRYCPSCLSSVSSSLLARTAPPTSSVLPPAFLLPLRNATQLRTAAQSTQQKYKRKDAPATQRKKKTRTTYETPDLKDAMQFSLIDAMRYLRAAEVGYAPTVSKYDLAIKLKTPKNGAVVRNRLRLPHPVKTDLRICVICPPDSAAANEARQAGAVVIGEESVFDAVKAGRIDFDRCICHQDSLQKLAKSGVARILGPRGLMPSAKLGSVVKDVASSVRDMVGGSEYRERIGVVRMAIGQLGFTPDEMSRNIRALIGSVKKDIAGLSDRIPKDIHEVVLSSTHGPGLSLNGNLASANSPPKADLSTL